MVNLYYLLLQAQLERIQQCFVEGVKKTNKYKEATYSFDQLIIHQIQIYQIMLAVNLFIFLFPLQISFIYIYNY